MWTCDLKKKGQRSWGNGLRSCHHKRRQTVDCGYLSWGRWWWWFYSWCFTQLVAPGDDLWSLQWQKEEKTDLLCFWVLELFSNLIILKYRSWTCNKQKHKQKETQIHRRFFYKIIGFRCICVASSHFQASKNNTKWQPPPPTLNMCPTFILHVFWPGFRHIIYILTPNLVACHTNRKLCPRLLSLSTLLQH